VKDATYSSKCKDAPAVGTAGVESKEDKMNPMKIISLGMTFYNLNKGLADDGKKIVDEGMDIIQAISVALKDGKVTNSEKQAITKEIKEFSKVSIKAIESITIPESD
jgi:hypothetical protein